MRRVALLALLTAATAGCYRSHLRAADAGTDADSADAGPSTPDAGPAPCRTVCEPPRVIASVQLQPFSLQGQAVLDIVAADDALVVLISAYDLLVTTGARSYALVRVPLTSGAPRVERHPMLTTRPGVSAGSLRATRTGLLRLVALTTGGELREAQRIDLLIADWASEGEPSIARLAVRDEPIPGCRRCLRLGAAVIQDEAHALAAIGSEGEMHGARVSLADLDAARWTLPIASAADDAPLFGVGAENRAVITVGGSNSAFGGSFGGGAFALAINTSEMLGPIVVPGAALDPPPQGVVFGDRSEVVRFTYDGDLTTGALRRYAVGALGLEELERIETTGGLPPLALTSTRSAIVWAEPDLALPGAANLLVLAHSSACTSEASTHAAHVPWPLGDSDPRQIAAAEHEGHTYVVVHEQRARGDSWITVLDLGDCRAQRAEP